MQTQQYRKKLIEVDIPLDAINHESARDASLTHGHPSTLHRYWARRPLAACRAVIFASIVDDPSTSGEFDTEAEQSEERKRLHGLIKRLIIWKDCSDENLLAEARYEIACSVARSRSEVAPTDADEVLDYLSRNAPPVYDPFCGGGSISLEAQRLGLRAIASDLNPLPVLITKALIEIPPQFAGNSPVNPASEPLRMSVSEQNMDSPPSWKGSAGLADDIRYYGNWMCVEAEKRIGHLYPKIQILEGDTATVVAWLWARTVPCANPACGIEMPLMTTFQLSTKSGDEHWTRPRVNQESKEILWTVQSRPDGIPKNGTVNRHGASCVACGSPVKLRYVREQCNAGKMSETLTAIVVESKGKRRFLSPLDAHVKIAQSAEPERKPEQPMPNNPTLVSGRGYGITHWHQLFTKRQTVALNTFGDLLAKVRHLIIQEGTEAKYANSVCTYLALAIGRMAESGCKGAWWENGSPCLRTVFARQAIQMTWSFAEANPFSTSTQNWRAQIEWIAKVIENLPTSVNKGEVFQADAATTTHAYNSPLIATDPPYYDNIDYADLSDFFYVWLRPLLRGIYPDLFSSILTPKDEEIVAIPSRFDDSARRFEQLLGKALFQMRQQCSLEFPIAIMYAYKQHEENRGGKTSTGWETMLTALVNSGFQVVGTWPMRTEQSKAMKTTKNALASSIILVCRPRSENAPFTDRRTFVNKLAEELPPALDKLTRVARINPVDLAQAAIGPGMEVYSRYSKVIRASGQPVTIREALIEINDQIAAYHEKETGVLDSETQFCLTWIRKHGYMEGDFGDAQLLATAKGVDIGRMHDKLLAAERGQVRLLSGDEFAERDYSEDMCTWEGCARMAWHLEIGEKRGGIQGCVSVGRTMRSRYESVERLARLLYNYYENRGDSQNAVRYSSLVTEWRIITEEIGLDIEQLEFM